MEGSGHGPRDVLTKHYFRSQTLKVVSKEDLVPCSVEVYRRFRGAYCLHHQGDSFVLYILNRQYYPLKFQRGLCYTICV
jgi:hypothetical protein